MPNTLVHFAAQGAASRSLWRRLDARWIYVGCLLPDVPWIARRAVASLGVAVDPIDLRLQAMVQASLAGTLLLCVVLGHARPKRLRTYMPTLPLGEAREALPKWGEELDRVLGVAIIAQAPDAAVSVGLS